MFACPIITHEHLNQFASKVVGELNRTTGMFLGFLIEFVDFLKGKLRIQAELGSQYYIKASLGTQLCPELNFCFQSQTRLQFEFSGDFTEFPQSKFEAIVPGVQEL